MPKLQADDLQTGQWITVLSGTKKTMWREPAVEGMAKMLGPPRIEQVAKELRGVPLQVVAVNRPFLAVRDPVHNIRLILDLREVVLSRLNDEYVKALAPEPHITVGLLDEGAECDDPENGARVEDCAECPVEGCTIRKAPFSGRLG